MDDRRLLRAQELSWCVSEGAILDRCSLEIHAGRFTALVGPNGAGKSTLLQLMAGTLGYSRTQFQGAIQWKQQDWCALPARSRAARIAYVSSDLDPAFPMTVEEVVASGAFASGKPESITPALELCDLTSFRSRPFELLSGGERQRVALARALVQGAEVLFLDETLSKMDLDYQLDLGTKLKRMLAGDPVFPFLVSAVVLVSHDLGLALRFADEAWVLHRGSLLSSGSVSEALTEEVLHAIYPRAAPGLLLQK